RYAPPRDAFGRSDPDGAPSAIAAKTEIHRDRVGGGRAVLSFGDGNGGRRAVISRWNAADGPARYSSSILHFTLSRRRGVNSTSAASSSCAAFAGLNSLNLRADVRTFFSSEPTVWLYVSTVFPMASPSFE